MKSEGPKTCHVSDAQSLLVNLCSLCSGASVGDAGVAVFQVGSWKLAAR